MTTVQHESENLRKATKWLLETRTYEPDKALSKLIEEACNKFDLSPLEAEFLERFVKQENL